MRPGTITQAIQDIRDGRLVIVADDEQRENEGDLVVPHGSITVDGVSLTVNHIPGPDAVGLSIIEYTWRHTTFADLTEGARVHVEGDVVGKYVRRLLQPYLAAR